jgi:hypothetical protein
MSMGEAASLAQTMPGRIKFVGLDVDIVRGLRDHHQIEPKVRRSFNDIQIGPDGLVYAPIDHVAPRSVTI